LSEPDGLSLDPAALVDQAVALADSEWLYLSGSGGDFDRQRPGA